MMLVFEVLSGITLEQTKRTICAFAFQRRRDGVRVAELTSA
jgi:hypothetical protein